MKIATWNVNSVRTRLPRLLRWLAAERPDALCLQELKATEAEFPLLDLQAAGYHAAVFGQKAYNGVAVVSRTAPSDVRRGMDDGVDDPQARLVSAGIGGVRVVSAYVPNGRTVGSDGWRYKLEWLSRLRRHLEATADPTDLLAVCGDFNVAPEARDVARPAAWEGSVLFHPEIRRALADVVDWGLVDVFRLHHGEAGLYSWWDYRMLGFPKNDGLRIDHILATRPLAARCTGARIDREERKGQQPSDHAPVVAEFDLPSS